MMYQFKSKGRRPGKPINPTHRETQARMNQSCRVCRERTGNGDICSDLSESRHNGVNDRSDEDESDKSTDRASVCDGRTTTNEKTSSNGTA
jgi:hypothetical protein